MQRMTESEIDQTLNEEQSLIGYQLQKILFDEKVLQLQFYGKKGGVWLTFSMRPGNPYLFFSHQKIPLIKNQNKPIGLFLKTHFKDLFLESLQRDQKLGRVVTLTFQSDSLASLQLQMVPGHVNVTAQVDKKSVFAVKPKELPEKGETPFNEKGNQGRSNEDFQNYWIQSQGGGEGDSRDFSAKDLKKKRAGLEKMQVKLEQLKDDKWKKLGGWLKAEQTLEGVPRQWSDLVDLDQSLAWNIQNCFEKAKKNQSKIKGTEGRIAELNQEIQNREGGKFKKPELTTPSLLAQAQVKGKTHSLDVGRLFIGRSGPENLSLLRKAKPWYYWLHIKDYPGAYGVIERNKGKKISESALKEASLLVVKQSLPKGASGVFEVIYAECRYVRPIKGAKSGQVTYSHEKVLAIKVDA